MEKGPKGFVLNGLQLHWISMEVGSTRYLERVMGIEPTPSAWEAEVLPLNYTRRMAETREFNIAAAVS